MHSWRESVSDLPTTLQGNMLYKMTEAAVIVLHDACWHGIRVLFALVSISMIYSDCFSIVAYNSIEVNYRFSF